MSVCPLQGPAAEYSTALTNPRELGKSSSDVSGLQGVRLKAGKGRETGNIKVARHIATK